MTGLMARVERELLVRSCGHKTAVLDAQAGEWVCVQCGNRRPVLRDADGRALARQGNR